MRSALRIIVCLGCIVALRSIAAEGISGLMLVVVLLTYESVFDLKTGALALSFAEASRG